MDDNNSLALRNLDDVERLAKISVASGLCRVRRAEEAAVILLTGRELGLSPMQSLRGIYVVSGSPVLSADLLVAVVRRSGLCSSWRVVESTEERCTITTTRQGETEPQSRTWTMIDAKRAQVTGKPIWSQYPRTMLRHRCAADLAREVYPDVVLGLYDPEEIGADEPRRDTPPAPLALPRDNGAPPSRAIPATAPEDSAPVVAAPTWTPPLTDRDLQGMLGTLAEAPDLATLRAAVTAMAGDAERGTEEQRSAIRSAYAARKSALAPTTPDGDEPTPSGPKGRRKAPAKAQPDDATGDAAPAANDSQGAAASAWQPFATSDGVTVRDEAHAREVLRGYPLPRIVRSARLHTPAWQALCDAEAAKRAAMPATRAA